MGIYPIECPTCQSMHQWFSGIADQRCAECRTKTVPAKPMDAAMRAHLRKTLDKTTSLNYSSLQVDAVVFGQLLDALDAAEAEPDLLSDKCSQKPILEFEGFIVRPYDGWNLFLESPSGEGTTIRRAEFLGMLAKLFKDNF
jgi:hypothetical protein